MITYCYGTSKTDAYPKMFTAPNFDEFVSQVLAFPRARTKGHQYICAPLRRNGIEDLHRCRADVLPRWWLGADLDGGSREEVDILLVRLSDYRAVAWQTASSTPEHPRWRIIVFLDREVDRSEGKRLGAAFVGVLGDGLPSLKWDHSTHLGEQMCYLPLAGAQVTQYRGDAVDVDAVLALAPEEPPRERPATPDPYEALIIEHGLFLHEIDASKAAITCPFEEDHSEKTSDSSTVYFRPLHGGYRWGRIHCSHTTHCKDRTQEDFIEKLGGDPRYVWREQAREAPATEGRYSEGPGKGNGKAEGERDISGNGKDTGGGASTETEWPEAMAPRAYHGLAGEMVKAIEPHTESDPAALLVQILVAFGAFVGRTPYVQVEGDRHFANLFALLIGGTSKGRKGTSWGRVRSIFEKVYSWVRVLTGLSSGEGLKWQVRDPVYKIEKDVEVRTDEGVADKRLLVIEPEFAAVTRVVARQGNTLSSTVRSAWDTGYLATLTKHDPITATDAHISITGHVTTDELRSELTQTDTANGFINRFLFVCVRRSRLLPFGGEDLPESVVADFARQLAKVGGAARRVGRVTMTEAARRGWERVYPILSEGRPGLFGAATARAEAQVVRLAMIYALLDEKAQIDAPHLQAALAVWEYCEASARCVFGARVGDPVADEILRALGAAGQGGMTRTQISSLFHRNYPAGQIGVALDLLERRKLARKDSRGTDGRPAEVWVRL